MVNDVKDVDNNENIENIAGEEMVYSVWDEPTLELKADIKYLVTAKRQSVIQNFYMNTDYVLVTQQDGKGNFYLYQCKLNSNKNAVVYNESTCTSV